MIIPALLFTPLAAAAIVALCQRGYKSLIEYVSLIAATIEVGFALAIGSEVLKTGTVATDIFLQADALGAFVVLFISVVGFAACIHSIGHLREEVRKDIVGFSRVREYFILFHLFFFAMYGTMMTSVPLLMWAAIEATTLASAFLITFYNKASALEAGWKFLIINSVGLLLGFLGTLLFLSAAATSGARDPLLTWSALQAIAPSLDPTMIKIAFIFVLVGFGTKVGLVPMHTWLPDAHSKAPVPISALLSGVLLNIALVGIVRFRTIADITIGKTFSQELLMIFGILSIVLAAGIILVQKNYKRLLAYSSIEHMGILTVGFALGGAATVAALFHMLYHALLKPILFFSAGNFFLKYSSTKIGRVRGALAKLPFSASAFIAAVFALTGVPPSGIFFTKLTILSQGMSMYPYVSVVMIVMLLIVFAGFLRHSTAMLFSDAPSDIQAGEINKWTILSIAVLFIFFATLSLYVPPALNELVDRAASLIN